MPPRSPPNSKPPNHLIIVCGHGIWLGGPEKGWDENEWLIESYKTGETPTFIEHIKAGVKVLSKDDRSLLVFSGGPTWKETPLSEAESYKRLALANGLFGFVPESKMEVARPRILAEERALDSYYNILFSLVHFWRETGVWPEHLTIVSHAFKRARLVDGHCAAIGFPLDKITFIGINPPGIEDRPSSSEQNTDGGLVLSDQVSKLKGDVMTGVSQTLDDWVKDPHGIGEVLADKRRKRNPWGIDQSLFSQEERERSGVQTRFLEDGTEALVEGGTRPWAVAYITGVEETAARTENRQE